MSSRVSPPEACLLLSSEGTAMGRIGLGGGNLGESMWCERHVGVTFVTTVTRCSCSIACNDAGVSQYGLQSPTIPSYSFPLLSTIPPSLLCPTTSNIPLTQHNPSHDNHVGFNVPHVDFSPTSLHRSPQHFCRTLHRHTAFPRVFCEQ